jgi:hypothetical protein
MKTLILSTVTAAVIALSASTAFASGGHTDQGADIMLQSQGEKYATPGNRTSDRQFLSGQTVYSQPVFEHRR